MVLEEVESYLMSTTRKQHEHGYERRYGATKKSGAFDPPVSGAIIEPDPNEQNGRSRRGEQGRCGGGARAEAGQGAHAAPLPGHRHHGYADRPYDHKQT